MSFEVNYGANGNMIGWFEGSTKQGEWWIDSNTLCTQWKTPKQSRKHCSTIELQGNKGRFERVDGSLSGTFKYSGDLTASLPTDQKPTTEEQNQVLYGAIIPFASNRPTSQAHIDAVKRLSEPILHEIFSFDWLSPTDLSEDKFAPDALSQHVFWRGFGSNKELALEPIFTYGKDAGYDFFITGRIDGNLKTLWKDVTLYVIDINAGKAIEIEGLTEENLPTKLKPVLGTL